LAAARAPHGGAEPSGHWAWRPLYDATTLSCTTRVSARSAPGPSSTALDRPRPPFISAATPRPAAGTADQTAEARTPAPAARTRTAPHAAARAPKRRARLRGRRARGTPPPGAIPLPRP